MLTQDQIDKIKEAIKDWRVGIATGIGVLLIAIGTIIVGEPTPDPQPAPVEPVEVNVNLADPPTTASLSDMTAIPPGDQARPVVSDANQPEAEAGRNPQTQILDGWGAGSKTYVSTSKIRKPNPWTPAQAVTYAIGQATKPDKNYYMLCDHFTAWVYGWGGSGYPSAKAHMNAIPKSLRNKIPSDHSTIPAGAIIPFGEGKYGHIVISVGNGKVASNDIVTPGRIDIVPLSRFKQKWGYTPAFWSQPDFLAAFGRNPNPAPVVNKRPQGRTITLSKIQRVAKTRGKGAGTSWLRVNTNATNITPRWTRAMSRHWKRTTGSQYPYPTCTTLKRVGNGTIGNGKIKFGASC